MQQPPGYQPQGPQGGPQYQQRGQAYPRGGPQYQQPGPQYGQMPYYPPQKKGLPGWAWGLIIGAIVLFCGFPILALAAIPLITSNTREARRAEGEQLMMSGRDFARVQYAKTGSNPQSFSRFSSPSEFTGKYYRLDDAIKDKPNKSAEITCSPQQTMSDGKGRLEFQWSGGKGKTTWDN